MGGQADVRMDRARVEDVMIDERESLVAALSRKSLSECLLRTQLS